MSKVHLLISGKVSVTPILKSVPDEESLHPWVKVNQANRPVPPKRLSILEGLNTDPEYK